MERLTHERKSGMKTGYWSPNKKQELVDRLAMYEDREDAKDTNVLGKWIPISEAKKQKAIEDIHKFGYDDAKLELATMQLELQIMKQDGGSHETADDGFMDAMNATASEVWGDQDV